MRKQRKHEARNTFVLFSPIMQPSGSLARENLKTRENSRKEELLHFLRPPFDSKRVSRQITKR